MAATFAGGVGVAGKASKGAKAAEGLADMADAANDAARAADAASDAARGADRAGDITPTGDGVAATALKVSERTFGRNKTRWTTDAQGRLISARATLNEVFEGLPRSSAEKAAQREAAKKGIAGDHGGHAVPHRFMGDQGSINLFPQNGVPNAGRKNFNGSAFKTLENELAAWVEAGGTLKYDIKFSNFSGDRPGRVRIEYSVFNESGAKVFQNRDRFTNEAGQVFDRVSKDFIQDRLNAAASGN